MSELEELRAEIAAIDKEMATLFEKRLQLCEGIARCKAEAGIPIFDPEQEQKVLQRNLPLIDDPAKRELYRHYLENLMDISKQYQEEV